VELFGIAKYSFVGGACSYITAYISVQCSQAGWVIIGYSKGNLRLTDGILLSFLGIVYLDLRHVQRWEYDYQRNRILISIRRPR